MFQFQYGSIGSCEALRLALVFVCFNSSMVRLGVDKILSSQAANLGFNSSMVRLGDVAVDVFTSSENSFNSSMVRLGVCRIFKDRVQIISFNSSMVRLGAVTFDTNGLISLFQFQYGSIGRVFQFWVMERHKSFQFQYGSIGRGINDVTSDYNRIVSIPVWFDWEHLFALKLRCKIRCFNSSMVRLGELF